jgi:hypothetical protein
MENVEVLVMVEGNGGVVWFERDDEMEDEFATK